MGDFARGRSPGAGNKSRAVRRGAARNSLQDLYLILLIFCSEMEAREATPRQAAGVLRGNLNRWAEMYNLMGSSFSYGKQSTDPKATVETTPVEGQPSSRSVDRR